MSIQKDIQELLKAEVISKEVANKIDEYYKRKSGPSTNRQFVAFGILGAMLVGLGIILIVAHNWDELSRPAKTIFAFLPLIVGQIASGYTLLKKENSVAWREGSTTFLFFAVGSSISLVSQIYNIPGELDSFLLLWMLLCLPLIYVMRSSIASLLYLIGITTYACEVSYWAHPSQESYLYWLLLLAALPHYYLLYKNKPKSNFMFFHHWFVPLSVIITLGTVADTKEELMFVAYFSLFGLFTLVGNTNFFARQKLMRNGYMILGSLGTVFMLLMLSFSWFWDEIRGEPYPLTEVLLSAEFVATLILVFVASGLLYGQYKKDGFKALQPTSVVFLLFALTFIIGFFSVAAVVLVNLIILAMGILIILEGTKQNHLGVLNYGLLIITALVICRFFDTDISFVVRGIMFVAVGAGFFGSNYWMLKKRKANG
jgi:uncharacterized membrane protein